MSNTPARDKLLAELRRDGPGHTGMGAAKIIDDYAHELAEHIRDDLGGDGGFPDGMRYAADLIDPETT